MTDDYKNMFAGMDENEFRTVGEILKSITKGISDSPDLPEGYRTAALMLVELDELENELHEFMDNFVEYNPKEGLKRGSQRKEAYELLKSLRKQVRNFMDKIKVEKDSMPDVTVSEFVGVEDFGETEKDGTD